MVTVFSTHDPELANRIANSDGVREFIRDDGEPVDLTPVVEPPSTQTGIVALTNGEDALALFVMTHPAIYQTHTLFAKSCRGKRAMETAKAMLAWLKERGAKKIWGDTPRSNPRACMFNRLMGAIELPTSDATHFIFEKVL